MGRQESAHDPGGRGGPGGQRGGPEGAGRAERSAAGAAAQRGSAPLRARCRATPGSGRVGNAHPPPRRAASGDPLPCGSVYPSVIRGLPWRNRKDGADTWGAAAFGGPGACRPPDQPNKSEGPGAFGPRPRSFRALCAQPPPPLRRVFHQRQSGFLQRPCALGFRLAFSAAGGARLRLAAGRIPGPSAAGKPAGVGYTACVPAPAASGKNCAKRVDKEGKRLYTCIQ